MSEEYYQRNLFGEEVNVGLEEGESEGGEIEASKNAFNVFALTDAVGARSKREAWVIYERALASGLSAEEIFWRVAWGVKALLLAALAASAEEAGLNPFVYKKAKANLKNWEPTELQKLSEDLTLGFHQARRGSFEIETLLERIILSI